MDGDLRVGILGGAFNPPHIGHLICAQEARWRLELDRVLLMPAGVAPHREIEHDPGAEQRYRLCGAAADGTDWLEASRLEVDREGPAYTVDTLERLHEDHPHDELFFLAGADQAARLGSWHDPGRVLALATFAVAERAGTSRADVLAAVVPIDSAERLTFFDMPVVEVSSSDIRARIAAGHPYRFLLAGPVADMIAAAGLYRAEVLR